MTCFPSGIEYNLWESLTLSTSILSFVSAFGKYNINLQSIFNENKYSLHI
jgi:hypothetical protein